MDKLFISVIIPTWRKNKILTRCLNSLLRQNYPQNRFEIIIISQKKINPLNKKIKAIQIEKDKNHAEARNVGVSYARGEIIAFCDDDCILPKNWLLTAADYFIDKKIDLIGGPVLPPKKAPLKYRVAGYLAGSRFTVGFAAARHRIIFPEQEANEFDLILANTFLRKSVFEKFGGFNKDQVPCEENFLYAKLKQNGYKLLYSPKIACSHPAKPVFLPWAKKIFFYATGRGLMIARAPETFHPQYFIPSLFIISFSLLAILSPFSLLAFSFLLAIILVYTILTLVNTFYIFLKFEKKLSILVIAPITSFIIHWAYGLGFLNGFVRYSFGEKKTAKMPSKY